jgi:hypothetical protein
LGKIILSSSFLDRHIYEIDDNGESLSRLFGIYDGETKLDFFAGNVFKNVIFRQLNQEIKFQSDLGGKLEFTIGGFQLAGVSRENWNSKMPGSGPYIALHVYDDIKYAY